MAYRRSVNLKQLRKVSVCTLAYKEDNPVTNATIASLIQKASDDYKKNVGIELNIVESHTTSLDVMKSLGLCREFRSECQSGDIVFVFTNRSMPYINNRTILGRSNSDWAVCFVYETNGRLFNLDLQNPSSRRTVEHEVGHLFGAPDNFGLKSIMDENSNCDLIWPKELKNIILDNKFRNFGPP